MTDNVLNAGRQLRQNGLAASAMSVHIRHGYRHHGQCGYFTRDIHFDGPASSDIELAESAKYILERIYQAGYRYTQGGVILYNLSDAKFRQRELFGDGTYERRLRLERFSRSVDAINEHFGVRAIYPASLAIKSKKWLPNRNYLSEKRYSLAGQGTTQACQARLRAI
jgi:hypothetical protein